MSVPSEPALLEVQADMRELVDENRRLVEYLRGIAERATAAPVDDTVPRWEEQLREAEQREVAMAARLTLVDAEVAALRRTLGESEAHAARLASDRDRLAAELAQRGPVPVDALDLGPARELLLREPVSLDAAKAAVLALVIEQRPHDLPAREALAGALLATGDHVGAEGVLQGAVATLSPAGAARYVEATLRGRLLPQGNALARADWSVGQVAAEFRRSPTWLKPIDVAAVLGGIDGNWPPGMATWLGDVGVGLRGPALQPLFDGWCQFDESVAAEQIVDWVREARVSVLAEGWCREGLELVAIESSDRKVALSAFRQLLETARSSQDWDAVARLLDRARLRLSSRDWLAIGREVVLADLQGPAARHPALPALIEELLGLGDAVRERGEQRELLAAAQEVARQLPPEATVALRARLDAATAAAANDGAKDAGLAAVTTVYEALVHARDRYPALLILKEAEESARQRASAGTRQALESLNALGEWAQRLAIDTGPETSAALRKIPGFREDVSATARQLYRRYYDRKLDDGSVIQLGPHLDAGGAGGRLYFYVDQDRRRVIVGHVGKHLPGKRDT